MNFLLKYLDFHAKRDKLHLLKAISAPFMLEYDFQPVVTSFVCIALNTLIMMMTIGTSTS